MEGGREPQAATAAGEASAAVEDVGRAEEATEGEEARSEGAEDEALLLRAQRLISKINASQENPNPRDLHALASILETQESRYVKESGSSNVARSSHAIGKLSNLVRENDEFYELISSRFLSESRYSISIRAASARILLSCPSTGMYPHVFDATVLDNFKTWVMEDSIEPQAVACNWKHELGRSKPTDFEMLKTYATGLLAMSLAGGAKVVEDILTSGLSAKLMRYLRVQILGEASSSQKDISSQAEARHHAVPTSTRGREENKGRSRQVLDGLRLVDECLPVDQNVERDRDKIIGVRQAREVECRGDVGELLKSELSASSTDVNIYELIDGDGDGVDDNGWDNRDLLDGKSRFGERQVARSAHEDVDESVRDDSARRRTNRGWPRPRGKGRIPEGTLENERPLLSPSSGLRLGEVTRSSTDRNRCKVEGSQKVLDAKNNLISTDSFCSNTEEDNDDRLLECLIGSMDISDIVKKATRAAGAEARAANAPTEAVRAARDAAAELVKSAALEVWKNTNDVETAVLAASKAASTVVDAAMATKALSSSLETINGLVESKPVKCKVEEEPEEFFILDIESLAHLREKYCILCLEILGEYVEALGPVLHEKGVDVSLALLQRCSSGGETTDNFGLLPEVLKLICALAAHKKFAALFVDRGGMQKLLAVPPASHTSVGLSSCLFTIGSLQGVMERVCASDYVSQVVALALKLLECSQEIARKNAAIFFSGAFVFRAILDSFDAQDGMQKMLNLLQGAASVRSGGNSGVLGMPSANLQNDRSPSEVLSSQEKAIAYHTCVALRQYFRAHLLMLVDSLRPNKSSKNVARGSSSARAAYKPLDISNEAMDVVFRQIQRDRKLGSAFVRARWPAIDKVLASNGHITMLELCQAPTVERYLHDLAQYALGVLHIVTLVPYGRKLIVNATLSNDRVGMAIILDAANGAGYVDPEVIQPALNVIVNLVCPPPSISTKPSMPGPSQLSASSNLANGSSVENKERHLDRSMSERNYTVPTANESRESNISDRGTGISAYSLQTSVPAMPSGVVGDRRICLGPGAGCAGLAAQLEQGYRQAREAVRANNGIKVLLHLLHPRMITPPQALDCIRALACRVLLGLARDETIAHILTKLQVGKKLSELIRDFGSQASGNEQKRWQTELTQVAIELIAIVTNSGRASTLAATDAAAPTLRRIERAAIAAATPITYHSRELLLLIHEHLQVSGLFASAAALQKEAELTPLPSLLSTPTLHQTSIQETSAVHIHWPSGRAPSGFLSDFMKPVVREEDANLKTDSAPSSSRKKALVFASNLSVAKIQPLTNSSSAAAVSASSKTSVANSELDLDSVVKTPIVLPMKRKLVEVKDPSSTTPTAKRLAVAEFSSPPAFQNYSFGRRNSPAVDGNIQYSIGSLTPRSLSNRLTAISIPVDNDDAHLLGTSGAPVTAGSQSGLPGEQLPGNTERMTLDSLVVQYLKHQHRQCPAPITTLPPLSLLHSHVCPEPSRSLNAPANVTARVGACELGKQHRGIHTSRRDRQFVYSRFRPCRTCRDDVALLTSLTFLGNSYHIATGSHSGELKIFDTSNGNVLESYAGHQTPIPMVQSALSVDTQLILSSGSFDVKLWDASAVSNGPFQTFDGCKTARFSHAGTSFAALSTDASSREVLLYDIQTCNVELKLSDTSSNPSGIGRGHTQSLIHFSPLDTMLLWNGVLWDRRSAAPLHRFDQFTDYGGGGFHPSGNEVILNSEVWDLRKFKLLRSVPSLDQTVVTFSSGGDVIYAILRRNLEDVTSAVNTRRVRHPLFPAFRTIDATNYSDIATVPVDRCVLDFAADPTDSYVGVIAMDDHEDMFSSARLYEIGRRRPTDDDSDPDDGGDTDEEEDEEDDTDADMDEVLGGESDIEGDSDSDDASNDEDDEDIESGDEMDEEADFNLDDVDLEGGQGLLEIIAGSDDGEEEDSGLESYSSDGEGDFSANGFGF